ncbi:MAG: hypothetical protein AABY05_01230 [Nanoarchaeota archaeon]
MEEQKCPRCGDEVCLLIEGQIYNNCPECGTKTCYSEKYDTTFCSKCNKWLEDCCNDSGCEFCAQRPEKPIK